jgi:hypothetical protein
MIEINQIEGQKEVDAILPAWFLKRMACDSWYFGLLMITGDVICISSIVSISSDGKWIDVLLLDDKFDVQGNLNISGKLITAPNERNDCSIQVAHIVAAIELAYT